MSLEWKVVRKEEQPVTRWSGGTTTELAIYPASSSYLTRDFIWRLSRATIETPASVFTPLPGYRRRLMVLEGNVLLDHEGHHHAKLRPFEQDDFDGGWTTCSRGIASDLNLMMGAGCEGELLTHLIRPEQAQVSIPKITQPPNASSPGSFPLVFRAFLCLNGTPEAIWEGEGPVLLYAGDLLTITEPDGVDGAAIRFSARPGEEVRMIEARIFYDQK